MADKELLKEELPSGKKVVFLAAKGRALINAHRKAGNDGSRLGFALLSEMIEVDGKRVLMEEIEEMDLFDVLALQGFWDGLSKGKKPTQAPKS